VMLVENLAQSAAEDGAHHVPGEQRLGVPVVNEVAALATRAFEMHVERRLRSVAIFERHDGA